MYLRILLCVICAVVLSGCGTQPSVPESTRQVANDEVTYSLLNTYTVLLGQLHSWEKPSRAAHLSINFQKNEIRWNGHQLVYIGSNCFIEPVSKTWVRLPDTLSADGTAAAATNKVQGTLDLEGWMVPKRYAQAVLADLEKIHFPVAQRGLVPKYKHIDGTQIQITEYLYLGSFEMAEIGPLLDGRPATVRRVMFEDGSSAIELLSGTEQLVIWPNGNWYRTNLKLEGLAFSASDTYFEGVYLKLREIAASDSQQPLDKDRWKHLPRLDQRKAL